ncbi:NAD-P-binding protein [Rhodotorula toruloides]|uniref:NAD-P-binding protein n=1 Tax=Rhodotorula toruloides TaxID=5286 RepID=A0A2T0A4I4_RHOTO|nr:NAD-P-binding protein [Rhodotorula toruloides]
MAGGHDLKALSGSSMFDLTGVVAVVTGGASGIGLMIASTLLANNATVYIVDLNQKQTESIAERYSQLAKDSGSKGKIIGLQGDVGSKAGAEKIFEDVQKREAYVTVLFNNSGTMGEPTKPPEEQTPEAYKETFMKLGDGVFRDTMSVNTFGPYFLSIAFLPLLAASKTKAPYGEKFQPQIINTVSMNGWTKDPATGGCSYPYLLSKAALGHLTKLLAHDFLPLGIRVNSISPGWFVTGMPAPGTVDEYGISSKQGSLSSESFGFRTPVGGSGSATDVGSIALMLVVNRFVNGESVLVDGGTLLVHPSSY